MTNYWLAAGLMCLLALPGYAQEPPKVVAAEDASPKDVPVMPSALVDRLFEMGEKESDRIVRRTALGTCAKLPDQQQRFAATIERMLDSSDRATRDDAVRYLGAVDLSAERKVAAAIRHMRDKYSDTHRINYNDPPVRDILTKHSDVAMQVIVQHLENHGDLPVLYLDMADVCGIDVAKFQSLSIEYSKSEDAAVRLRVAQLLSNRLDERLREWKREQQVSSESQEAFDKYLHYSQRIISRYDQDQSGSLNQAEWDKMLVNPSAADQDGDGEITVLEYRDYLLSKQKGR